MRKDFSSDESSIGTGQDKDMALGKTNLELLQEMEDMLNAPNAETELDVDRLISNLTTLQERAPMAEGYTSGEIWNELKTTHPTLMGEQDKPSASPAEPAVSAPTGRKKGLGLFLRVAGSAAAVLLVLVVTANAWGVNPVKAFLNWADGIIQIYSNPSGVMELPEEADSEYRSLEEALAAYGVSSDGCPKWVPKDYALYDVRARDATDFIQFSAAYVSIRGDLVIRATQITGPSWSSVVEKESGGTTYTRNGVEYYITKNSDFGKVGWQIGDFSYVIDGQITENELRKMIDSIE